MGKVAKKIVLDGEEVNIPKGSGVPKEELEEAFAGKQDVLVGTQGQVVGFDADGNAVAQDAPDVGVTSFNNRSGAVTPQSGDYTAEQVGARPNTWMPTAADVGAATMDQVNTAISNSRLVLTQSQFDAIPVASRSSNIEYCIKEG